MAVRFLFRHKDKWGKMVIGIGKAMLNPFSVVQNLGLVASIAAGEAKHLGSEAVLQAKRKLRRAVFATAVVGSGAGYGYWKYQTWRGAKEEKKPQEMR